MLLFNGSILAYKLITPIEMSLIQVCIQWNLSVTDTFGPDIFGHCLLQYRGLPLSEVKNVLVTPVETKIFVLIMEVFSTVSLIRRVC